MSPIRELLTRYLDDRESLSEAEWETLLAELNISPTLVAELRDQLLLDDYLAQKLALDRVNFLSQVSQRVNDYDRQVAETFDHVAELRSLAEAELSKPAAKPPVAWWTWGASGAIVAAVALVMIGVLWQINWGEATSLAMVDSITGDVKVKSGGTEVPLAPGTELGSTQELTTGQGSSVVWKYKDGTSIRLEANTKARLSRHPDHEGKQVFLDQGSLWADIAPQIAGRPMTFVTPHAEAKVVGTKFKLVVLENESKLDVTEGIVDFSRPASNEVIRVEANRVSRIGAGHMELEPVTWPLRDGELIFQFNDIEKMPLTRNPAKTESLLETPLIHRHPEQVQAWKDRGMSLEGGSAISPAEEAGEDLRVLMRDRQDITVEMVIAAEQMGDMPQIGSGTLLGFAKKGGGGNFALRTADSQWIAQLRTEGNDAFHELKWSIDPPDEGRLHHIAWTYRPGEWKGYCDGEMFASRNDVQGNFNSWQPGALTVGADEDEANTWRGIIFGIAVYRRVLSAEELAENARHARTVYWPYAK